MRKALFPLVLLAAFLLCAMVRAGAEDDAAARALFDHMLAAQDAKDYEGFVANGTDQFKAALSRTQFEASSDILIANSAGGREVTFLGELNQRGYEIYLYRLRMKSGDLLGTLTLKDGKVAGIWFK